MIDALADKFSKTTERLGIVTVQGKQVWNWFQTKRFGNSEIDGRVSLRHEMLRMKPETELIVGDTAGEALNIRSASFKVSLGPLNTCQEGPGPDMAVNFPSITTIILCSLVALKVHAKKSKSKRSQKTENRKSSQANASMDQIDSKRLIPNESVTYLNFEHMFNRNAKVAEREKRMDSRECGCERGFRDTGKVGLREREDWLREREGRLSREEGLASREKRRYCGERR
ncbi:hypothetical protein Nepgr_027403 [Nepenthes gracilis]|uniref:Uncharacterized protein n=1 Tax=Nepenthes gracilis TaxID=150966 RepID=A0AAD3Y2X5_NEPGR|nr:hypothetical protein Nepgr_027403 [Nepenthes gracilis]